ncbi:hypoxanthine phosphoribosyltransferase [Desulfobacterales bacterium HSG16]|nr:hypoxanthine phosphoribosyltransferase [Desulfobacterales bacterium HSG16]
MPELIPVLSKNEIKKTVQNLGTTISSDYRNGQVVMIGVLKGAFIFMADLVRQLSIPVQTDFICASSYGNKTCSSGKVSFSKKIDIDIVDKDVILVEDIVDTGLTLVCLIEYVKSLGAKSVKICALIDKQERREIDIEIDYAGHSIEKGFLVGYGLDYAEDYRNLPEIFNLKL